MNVRCLTALLVLATAGAQAAMPRHPRPPYIEGEVLVRYRSEAAATSAKALHATRGFSLERQLRDGRTQLLRTPAFTTAPLAARLLREDPSVELAEPNFRRYARAFTPNDPLFPDQWGLHSTGQPNFASNDPALATAIGADLNMDQAWDANNDGTPDRVGLPSVVIAVIDDAVETGHDDLAPNIIAGRDFANGDADPNPDSAEESHGTAVAGAAAARGNNGLGVAGTAWNARLMPLKFDFSSATLLDALDFARDNGARIVNGSFGGPGFSQAEVDMLASLRDSDVLFVAAAGNDDSNTDKAQLNYPANYDVDNVVSVAATNRQDNIASFSQYGPTTVDVAAPGLQIITTTPGDAYTEAFQGAGPGIAGTSFSAPYVAGIAALIRSHVAGVTFRDIKARLVESGSAVDGANPEQRTAGGRVDADRALDMTPRPSLVIRSIAIDPAGNGVFDPGETAELRITIRNDWQNASNVRATLGVSGEATVNTGTVALGNIASLGTATATFSVTVPTDIAGHRYLPFRLALSADGGYATERPLLEEVGRLQPGRTQTQSFAARDDDLYDEFHAWHVTLPTQRDLTISTTSSRADGTGSPDIDLLVKRGTPPRYSITVGINPEQDEGFFCTSGTTENCQDPETFVSAGPEGTESITIPNAPAGTYHVVVVNFAQLDEGMLYRIRAGNAGTLQFGAGNFTVSEGGSASVTVTRSGGSDGAVSVQLATGNGTATAGADYTAVSTTVSFADGETSRSVVIPLIDDSAIEQPETVQLTLSAPTGDAQLGTASATLTIADNDGGPPPATGGGGGGGGGLATLLLAPLGLAALLRRRRRH